jgi:predicted RNA-binding Zn-ribbon protein involved in translation (DUF1610 family)
LLKAKTKIVTLAIMAALAVPLLSFTPGVCLAQDTVKADPVPAAKTPPPAGNPPVANGTDSGMPDVFTPIQPAVKDAIGTAATIAAQYLPAGISAPEIAFPKAAKITVDIKGRSLREALKKLFASASGSFEIDKDVPDNLDISLKATNVHLQRVVDVLTDALNIGFTMEYKPVLSSDEKKAASKLSIVYHFVKTPMKRYSAQDTFGTSNSYLYFNDALAKAEKAVRIAEDSHVLAPATVTVPALPAADTLQLKQELLKAQDDAKMQIAEAFAAVKAQKPLVYDIVTSEERSTFTCPSCKEQITVMRKHTTPKCPTCGKEFQKEWKFCPNDGAKRPADPTDWKFCPHCGKAVSH